jgi:hypothetical protein
LLLGKALAWPLQKRTSVLLFQLGVSVKGFVYQPHKGIGASGISVLESALVRPCAEASIFRSSLPPRAGAQVRSLNNGRVILDDQKTLLNIQALTIRKLQ